MKHEFIEDTDINIDQWDDVVSVEVCKYCDCQRWTILVVRPGKILKPQYMLNKGTQYWEPEEECPDSYGLAKL